MSRSPSDPITRTLKKRVTQSALLIVLIQLVIQPLVYQPLVHPVTGLGKITPKAGIAHAADGNSQPPDKNDSVEEILYSALYPQSEFLSPQDERAILSPVDAALRNPGSSQTLLDLFLVLNQSHYESILAERANLPLGQTLQLVDPSKKLPQFISYKRIATLQAQGGISVVVPYSTSAYETSSIFSPASDALENRGTPIELQIGGNTFHKIHLNAFPRSLGFFGKYLVFLAEGDYQSHEKLQNLYFVDLEAFQNNLGKESLPVFRLPVPTTSEIKEITRNADSSLQVGGLKLTLDGLNAVNQIWHDLFSFQVSSLDAEQLSKVAVQLADDVDTQISDAEFALTAEGESAEAAIAPAATLSKKIIGIIKGIRGKVVGIDDQKRAVDQVLSQDPKAKGILAEVQRRRKAQAGLYQKMSRALGYLSLPQADVGVRKLKSALAFAAGGLLHRKENAVIVDGVALSKGAAAREGMKQILHHPYVRAGGAAVGGALAATFFPEETSRLSLQLLLIGRDAATLVFGKLGDLGYLGGYTVKSVFTSLFSVNSWYQAYLADGKYSYFFPGLFGLIGTYYSLRTLPRYLVSLYRLSKDMTKQEFQNAIEKSNGFYSGFKKYLIEREETARKEYLSLLGKQADAKNNNQKSTNDYTREQTVFVRTIMQTVEENEKTWHIPYGKDKETNQWKMWSFKLPKVFKSKKNQKTVNSPLGEEISTASEKEIVTFLQALKHLLHGSARGFAAVPAFVKLWNGWFLFRAFVLHPRTVAPYLLYSKFYEVMFSDREAKEKYEKMRVPSFWNGGRRTRYQEFILWLKDHRLISANEFQNLSKKVADIQEVVPAKDSPELQAQDIAHLVSEIEEQVQRPLAVRVWEKFRKLINSSGIRENLERWENAFAEQEGVIHQEALRLAWFRTLDYLKTPEKRREWIDSGVPLGLAGLNQTSLTLQEKRFFHIYFNELSARGIRKLLESKIISDGGLSAEKLVSGISDDEIKRRVVEMGIVPNVSSAEVRQLLAQVDEQDGNHLFKEVEERSQKVTLEKDALTDEFTRVVMNFLRTDKNKQVKRVLSVNRMLENPDSVLRATLALNADSTVGKLMELVFTFLALSTVDSGFLQPFFPGSWFTDRAFFGFNRYVFLNGLMANSVLGVFSGPWLKLQQDEQHADQFGNIPEGADKNRKFIGWFGKQLFQNPENTPLTNQLHNNRIIWANMKPALVYMVVINYLTMGVMLPLDPYVVGYLLSYFGLYSGFLMWIDQGMELANSGYDAKFFPPELLGHPEVQEWITKRRSMRRMLHTVWNQAFETIVYQLVSIFANTGTPAIGPRSLSTLAFGTPLGVASHNLAETAEKALEGTLLSGCVKAFDDTVFNRGNPDVYPIEKKP